jgi:hypothetical protein
MEGQRGQNYFRAINSSDPFVSLRSSSWDSGMQCRDAESAPGRAGPERPGRHAPARNGDTTLLRDAACLTTRKVKGSRVLALKG